MTTPVVEPSDLTDGLSQRLTRNFRVQVEDWCDVCRRSVAWEECHLSGKPSLELLANHARLLAELERVGNFLLQAMQAAYLSDRATAELIAMTLQDLKDRRALWHGELKPQQREAILREVFNES